MKNAFLLERFSRSFGSRPDWLAFAPGRVNVISEHTDYCGGLVYPCALGYGTHAAASLSGDRDFHLVSAQMNFRFDGPLPAGPIPPGPSSPQAGDDRHWVNYVFGVIDGFHRRGMSVPGFTLAVNGDPHLTAGLSRSASLCSAVALLVQALAGTSFDRVELARICQEAEHRWAGVKCGIMDQSAILLSKRGHLLRLDCASMDYGYIPVSGVSIVVAHSGVFRSLTEGVYNARVDECGRALAAISEATGRQYDNLVSVPFSDLQLANLADARLRARATHVVTETRRAQLFELAMRAGDFAGAGALLDQTHESLKTDYDVSCPELDLLTEWLRREPGVFGARLTGGGCGGAAIALVEPGQADALVEALRTRYYPTYFPGDSRLVCFVTDLYDGAAVERVS